MTIYTMPRLSFKMYDYWRFVTAMQGNLSTCLKRSVTCVMVDGNGEVLAVESNQCSPPDGICPRLDLTTSKENFPPTTYCQSEHAEVRALKLSKLLPKKAYLFGHKFFCDDCERLLKSYGIELEVVGER